MVTPTLTGCGEKAGELSPDVTLDTHVEEISELVSGSTGGPTLLGTHSCSGMVISAVADAWADRLQGLHHIAAFYPEDGDSALP